MSSERPAAASNHSTAPAPGAVPSPNAKTPRAGSVSTSRPTSSTNNPTPTSGAGVTTRSTVNPASRPRRISDRSAPSNTAVTPPCKNTATPPSPGVITPNSTSYSSPLSNPINQLVANRATVRPRRRGSPEPACPTISSNAVIARAATESAVTTPPARWATTTTTPPAPATR